MGLVGSFVGAGIGWWMGGPVGAVLGFVVGHLAESKTSLTIDPDGDYDQQQARNGFLASLLVLVAAVMKADGKILRSELDFVRVNFTHTFGEAKAREAILHLRDIIKKDIDVTSVTDQMRVNLDYSSRLELLHLLYGIALSDNELSTAETVVIHQISVGLGITNADYMSIKNMIHKDIDSDYKVLEVDSSISDADLKKAYRKLAVLYHPDKVEHLGEDIKKSAEEKFKRVNEAYERVKKSRGIN